MRIAPDVCFHALHVLLEQALQPKCCFRAGQKCASDMEKACLEFAASDILLRLL